MARNQGLNRSLGSAIGAIALVALASGATVFVALHQLSAVNAARDRSNLILTELDAFRVAMLNLETGIRGYLLTGRQGSLAPYVFGRADFGAAVGKLRGLVAADAGQRRLLDRAEAAARGWQSEIGEPALSDMSRPGGRNAAIALESTGAGKARFDAFRESLAKIQLHERDALATRDRLVRHAGNRALAALALGTLLTLIICAGVGVAINRLITRPLIELAEVMGRLVRRDMTPPVPSLTQNNEVGDMARAVAVFKDSLIELDRTALLRVTADTLPAMVGYIDAQRRVGFLNGEFARWFDFAGHDVSEVQGRPLAEVFAAKPLPGAAERLEPAFAGEEGRFEQPLTLTTGERRDVEGYFRPHRGRRGMCWAWSPCSPTSPIARASTAAWRAKRATWRDRTRNWNSSPMSPRTI